jgi:8-oxo-dGTP pyrophosphatase MutT (NUDIX family)
MKSSLIKKLYSLVFIRDVQNNKFLLGYKKRGFGMNKWNGLGGKVESNETPYESAKREAKEECGLEVENLKNIGQIEFQFDDKMNEILEVHVFSTDCFKGELKESEGMTIKNLY